MDLGTGLALMGSAKLMEKLLGPSCEYIGKDIFLQWTQKMCNNVSRIITITKRILGDKINENGVVSPKVVKSVLDNGAWCEEELQCEYFGGVLASSRSGISRDDRGAYYSSIITELTSYQLRMHYLIYQEIYLIFSGGNYNIGDVATRKSLEIFIPEKTFFQAMNFSSDEKNRLHTLLSHIMFGLQRLVLIEEYFRFGPVESIRGWYTDAQDGGIILRPSQLGVELFMWAYGRGQDATNSFFSKQIAFKPVDGIEIGKAYPTQKNSNINNTK